MNRLATRRRPISRLLDRLRSRVVRLRHRRGHGVHSPYIYSIVREVFMRRTPIVHTSLGDDLQRCGVKGRMAVELQNVYVHCGYRSYVIDPQVGEMADFVVCTSAMTNERIDGVYEAAVEHGATIVVERGVGTTDQFSGIVKRHLSTVVDRPKYIIIFNNHLPKQYFQL
ncbi:MAG: hypothetical protein SNH63_03335 [Rikenellaceae bacterium]